MRIPDIRPTNRRRVVYTCLFGYSERFNDVAYEGGDIDFICFTDDPELRSAHWEIRRVDPGLLDAPRASKRIKHLPHLYLPDYAESLYIDNVVRLKQPPSVIFDCPGDPIQSPLRCFRHPWRDCIYDEAAEVIGLGFDDPARVEAQMAHYRNLGYPAHNGLAALCMLWRRHHDEQLMALSDTWDQQVLRHSMRDQLSFTVAAWHHKFAVGYLRGDLMHNDLIEWPVLKGHRLPRDFDDVIYLQLHPDVMAAGINPRQHYLVHGMAEGRPYKYGERRRREPD